MFITAFLTLPVADAIVGKEVKGVMAFCENELKKKLAKLNERSENFRVAELQIPTEGCKTREEIFIIPITTKATITNCYKVSDFIK